MWVIILGKLAEETFKQKIIWLSLRYKKYESRETNKIKDKVSLELSLVLGEYLDILLYFSDGGDWPLFLLNFPTKIMGGILYKFNN